MGVSAGGVEVVLEGLTQDFKREFNSADGVLQDFIKTVEGIRGVANGASSAMSAVGIAAVKAGASASSLGFLDQAMARAAEQGRFAADAAQKLSGNLGKLRSDAVQTQAIADAARENAKGFQEAAKEAAKFAKEMKGFGFAGPEAAKSAKEAKALAEAKSAAAKDAQRVARDAANAVISEERRVASESTRFAREAMAAKDAAAKEAARAQLQATKEVEQAQKKAAADAVRADQEMVASKQALVSTLTRVGVAAGAMSAAMGAISIATLKAADEDVKLQRRLDATFGDGANDVRKWSDAVGSSMSVVGDDVSQVAAKFATVVGPFTATTAEATAMSQTLTQAAFDLAAFSGASGGVEEAQMAIQQAINGTTRGLRGLGFGLTEAMIEAKALEMGFSGAVKDLSDADRASVMLAVTMDRLKVTQGAAAKASGDFGNQLRFAKGNTQEFAEEIGKNLKPATEGILKLFNSLLITLREMPDWIKKVGAAILVLGAAIAGIVSVAALATAAVLKLQLGFAAFVSTAAGAAIVANISAAFMLATSAAVGLTLALAKLVVPLLALAAAYKATTMAMESMGMKTVSVTDGLGAIFDALKEITEGDGGRVFENFKATIVSMIPGLSGVADMMGEVAGESAEAAIKAEHAIDQFLRLQKLQDEELLQAQPDTTEPSQKGAGVLRGEESKEQRAEFLDSLKKRQDAAAQAAKKHADAMKELADQMRAAQLVSEKAKSPLPGFADIEEQRKQAIAKVEASPADATTKASAIALENEASLVRMGEALTALPLDQFGIGLGMAVQQANGFGAGIADIAAASPSLAKRLQGIGDESTETEIAMAAARAGLQGSFADMDREARVLASSMPELARFTENAALRLEDFEQIAYHAGLAEDEKAAGLEKHKSLIKAQLDSMVKASVGTDKFKDVLAEASKSANRFGITLDKAAPEKIGKSERGSSIAGAVSGAVQDAFGGGADISRMVGSSISGTIERGMDVSQIGGTVASIAGGAIGSVIPGVGTAIGAAAGNAISNFFTTVTSTVSQMFGGVAEAIKGLLGEKLGKTVDSIATSVAAAGIGIYGLIAATAALGLSFVGIAAAVGILATTTGFMISAMVGIVSMINGGMAALASFAGVVVSVASVLGTIVVGIAAMPFVLAGFGAAIATLAQETNAYIGIQKDVEAVIGDTVKSLEPFVRKFRFVTGIVQMFADVVKPIIDTLAESEAIPRLFFIMLKSLAVALGQTVLAVVQVAQVFGPLIQGVASLGELLFKGIKDLAKTLGLKDVAEDARDMQGAFRSIRNASLAVDDIDTDEVQDAIDTLASSSYEDAQAMGNAQRERVALNELENNRVEDIQKQIQAIKEAEDIGKKKKLAMIKDLMKEEAKIRAKAQAKEQMRQQLDANAQLAQGTRQLSESVMNAVSDFKVAHARFASADAFAMPTGGTAPASTTGDVFQNALIMNEVIVYAANFEDFMSQMNERQRRSNIATGRGVTGGRSFTGKNE